MPRKPAEPIDPSVPRSIGALLRDVRRAAGYRAVRDAAAVPGCPAAQQTIYAYERGGLLPNLPQFLDLVEFYAGGGDAPEEARLRGIAAINAALGSPAYHLPRALELVRLLQPSPSPGRRRRQKR